MATRTKKEHETRQGYVLSTQNKQTTSRRCLAQRAKVEGALRDGKLRCGVKKASAALWVPQPFPTPLSHVPFTFSGRQYTYEPKAVLKRALLRNEILQYSVLLQHPPETRELGCLITAQMSQQ